MQDKPWLHPDALPRDVLSARYASQAVHWSSEWSLYSRLHERAEQKLTANDETVGMQALRHIP